jgi:hypothetical protein
MGRGFASFFCDLCDLLRLFAFFFLFLVIFAALGFSLAVYAPKLVSIRFLAGRSDHPDAQSVEPMNGPRPGASSEHVMERTVILSM